MKSFSKLPLYEKIFCLHVILTIILLFFVNWQMPCALLYIHFMSHIIYALFDYDWGDHP